MGIYFNIEPVSADELTTRVFSGEYQIALYELAPSGSSPTGLLEKFTSEYSGNPAGLSDPVYDAYVEAAYGANGVSACLSAEKYLNDACIFYPIYNTFAYYGVAPGVSGLRAFSFQSGIDFTGALFNEAE